MLTSLQASSPPSRLPHWSGCPVQFCRSMIGCPVPESIPWAGYRSPVSLRPEPDVDCVRAETHMSNRENPARRWHSFADFRMPHTTSPLSSGELWSRTVASDLPWRVQLFCRCLYTYRFEF